MGDSTLGLLHIVKTKTSPLMVCLSAIIALGSYYLISRQVVRLPDLMFSIIFGVCGVWTLLAAAFRTRP
jgi:hypothetical protein